MKRKTIKRDPNQPPTQPPTPPAPTPPTPPATPPSGGTFTPEQQERVNQIVAREVEKAGKKATQELLESWGVNKPEEVKELIEAVKAADEATKSEAQRALEAAQAAKAEAEAAQAKAKELAKGALITSALVTAGVTDPTQQAELALLVTPKVEGDDPTPDEVAAAVEKVKTTFPALFAGTGAPKPPSGDPRGKPPATGSTQGAAERGAQRAQRMGLAKVPATT